MEPKKLVCESCGAKVYRLVKKERKKICENCNETSQIENLDIAVPKVFVWIGEVARQGETRMFIIPKSQKPFLRQKVKYSIVVREL